MKRCVPKRLYSVSTAPEYRGSRRLFRCRQWVQINSNDSRPSKRQEDNRDTMMMRLADIEKEIGSCYRHGSLEPLLESRLNTVPENIPLFPQRNDEASRRENGCRESCSAGCLLGERVALQVVAGRVPPCVELLSDKLSETFYESLCCVLRVLRMVLGTSMYRIPATAVATKPTSFCWRIVSRTRPRRLFWRTLSARE
jgi:hypothetical protein